MTKWITGFVAALVVAVLALQGTGVASAQDSTPMPPNTEEIVLREGPTIKVDTIRGEITRGEDGHIQVIVTNSGVNEYSITGEIELNVTGNLYVYSGTSGVSGGSSLIIVPIANPIQPGSAGVYDFWVQSGESSNDVAVVNGRVFYWPTTGFNGVENIDEAKRVSWDASFVVKEASDNLGTPKVSPPTDEATQAPAPTPQILIPAVDIDDGFDLEIWMYFVIAVLGIIALIAIMRIIMN